MFVSIGGCDGTGMKIYIIALSIGKVSRNSDLCGSELIKLKSCSAAAAPPGTPTLFGVISADSFRPYPHLYAVVASARIRVLNNIYIMYTHVHFASIISDGLQEKTSYILYHSIMII